MPEAVRNLLAYSALKTMAEQIGIEAIDRRHNLLNIKFHKANAGGSGAADEYREQNQGRAVHSGRCIAIALGGEPDGRGDVLRFLSEKLDEPAGR